MIIDEDQFIISLDMDYSLCKSINPGDIMDDEPIYNAPKRLWIRAGIYNHPIL